MSSYLSDVACDTCGQEVESWDLVEIQDRLGDGPVRRICSECHSAAMDSDPDFWRRYWHGTD